MINEILNNCGIDSEKANEVLKAMDEAKIYTTKLENIDVRYSKLKDKLVQLEETNKNYEVQVSELSKNNKDNKELLSQLEQLELSNKDLKEKHTKELYQRDFDYALDKELNNAKSKNNKALKALLDIDSIKYQDGKIDGLESQLEALKEEAKYLFDLDTIPNTTGGLGNFGRDGGIAGENNSQSDFMAAIKNNSLRK